VKGLRLLVLITAAATVAPFVPAIATSSGAGRYIVVLRGDADPEAKSREHAARYGADADRYYRFALKGYAANVPEDRVDELRDDPSVLMISRNRTFRAAAETLPTGVNRVEADVMPGTGEGVQVAVLDSGIDLNHPDLAANIAGGADCDGANTNNWNDANGHGTHVAGTLAAIDNADGVVGVAPLAKLWAVRILNAAGAGDDESILCGLDFVDEHSPARGGSVLIANMSIEAIFDDPIDDGNCGETNDDPVHFMVCEVVAHGVTIVTAAGNSGIDFRTVAPAAYDEVITVTALADYNGEPCGGATPPAGFDPDDQFATDFSNYAVLSSDRAHTIGAPGTRILSTLPGASGFTQGPRDGTSMASPHVAGAAARYLQTHPGASPATVLEALLDSAEPEDVDFNGECPGTAFSHTDPTNLHPEPVLRIDEWAIPVQAVTPGVVRGNVWHLNNGFLGSADLVFGYGSPSDKVVAGDWNGDGIDTPGVVKGNVWYLNDGFDANAEHIFAFGSASDRVIVGDWDKDGDDTPAVVKGNVWFLNFGFDPSAEYSFAFGSASDRIVAGDWNFDGWDTPAVVKSNNIWFINQGYDSIAEHSFGFGVATATAIAGDWDGDTRDTVGIRIGKNWYLNLGFDPVAEIVFPYGNATDRPVVGDWDGETPP
jgi:subtilisin